MADYRVDVEVNVDDGKLDALESRIKGLKGESIKINADVDSKNIGSSVEKAMSNVRKHINVTGFKLGSGAIGFDAKSIKADSKKIQSDLIKDMSDAEELERVKNQASKEDQVRIDRMTELQNKIKSNNWKMGDIDLPVEEFDRLQKETQEASNEFDRLRGKIDSLSGENMGKLDALYGADKGQLQQTKEDVDGLISKMKEYGRENAKLESMRISGASADDIDKQQQAVDKLGKSIRETYSSLDKSQLSEKQLSKVAEARAKAIKQSNDAIAKAQEKQAKIKATAEEKAINAKLKEYKNIQREMNQLDVAMSKMDKDSTEYATATLQMKQLAESARSVRSEISGGIKGSTMFDDIDKDIEKTLRKLELTEAKVRDAKKKVFDNIGHQLEYGKYSIGNMAKTNDRIAELDKFEKYLLGNKYTKDKNNAYYGKESQIDKFVHKVNSVKDIKAEADVAYNKMIAAYSNGDVDNAIKSSLEYEHQMKRLTAAINEQARAQSKLQKAEALHGKRIAFEDKASIWKKNNTAAKEYFKTIDSLIAQSKNADEIGIQRLNEKLSHIDSQAKLQGVDGLDFGGRLKEKVKQYSSYFSVASVAFAGAQKMREMAQNVLEIDTAMTGLHRVTDLSASGYSELYDNMIVSAKEYGSTLSDIINATADWSRAGFDAKTANGLAEVTAMYQHVSDLDYAEASKNLLTSFNGFKGQLTEMFGEDQVGAGRYIADILNELDNNYSVTAAGIGEAMARSAASLDVAGNSIQETAAMVGAISEVTQDPEKAGNAMKVVSMRLRGMKGELEDLGEDVDDNVANISKMQGQVLNLTHGKVNIFDKDGEFKSTYEIMQGISKVWKDLNTIEQADLLETIAGKHRANDVASLISNWDNAEKMQKSAMEASGSATAENAKHLESLQGKLDSLTTSWQAFSSSAMDSGFLKGAVDALSKFLDLLNAVVDTFGTVGTIGLTAGAALGGFNRALFKSINVDSSFLKDKTTIFGSTLREISDGFSNGKSDKKGFSGFFAGMSGALKEINKEISPSDIKKIEKYNSIMKDFEGNQTRSKRAWKQAGMESAGVSAKNLVKNAEGYTVAADMLETAAKKTKTASIGMRAGMMALNAAVGIGIGVGIELLITGITKLVNYRKDLSKAADELKAEQMEKASKSKTDLDGLDAAIAKYKELSQLDTRDPEVRSQIKDVQAEINSLVGEQANGIDLVNGKLDTQISKLNVIKANKAEQAAFDAKEAYKAAKDSSEKALSSDPYGLLSGESSKYFDDALKQSDFYAGHAAKSYQSYGKDEYGQLKNASERVEYIDNMIKHLEETMPDYASDKGYQNLTKQRDALSSYANDVKLATNMLIEAEADRFESYKKFDDLNLHSVDDFERYRKSMLDSINSMPEIKTALEEGSVTDNEIRQYVNSRLGSSEQFSKVYSEWAKDISGYRDIEEIAAANLSDIFTDTSSEASKNLPKFKHSTDVYASRMNMLNDALERFQSGDMSESDISKLIMKFPDLNKAMKTLGVGTDDLDRAIISLMNDMDKDMTDNFNEQFKDMSDLPQEAQEAIERFGDTLFSLNQYGSGQAFNLSIETETDSLEKLNAALAESVTATGLSSESIDSLKARYNSVKGFSSAKLFERTANGIHLNHSYLKELENEYVNFNKIKIDNKLDSLTDEYNKLEEAKNGANLKGMSDILKRQDEIRAEIDAVQELGSQYAGLSSAYNQWQSAEAAGNERDMYESIVTAKKSIKDEMKRGWYDDGTTEYIELLSGKNLSTATLDEIKSAWDGIGQKINSAGYSVWDFFTKDKDGNSTSDGVFNFLDTVKAAQTELGKEWVKIDEKGNYSFDFGVNGDKAVADAIGVSEELVQIMVRAADDAGFVVNLDGTFTQLDALKDKAKEANDYLVNIGKTDHAFNLAPENKEQFDSEMQYAMDLLNKFRNEDKTINMDMDGAQQALDIASTYLSMADRLSQPTYMHLETSDVEMAIQEPLTKMQEFEFLSQQRHQLELEGKGVEEVETQMSSIVDYLDGLDEEKKIKLGIQDMDKDELYEGLENGTIEVPTTADVMLNVNTSMDEKLGNLVDIMLFENGIIDRQELNLRLGLNVETENLADNVEQAVADIEPAVKLKAELESGDVSGKTIEDFQNMPVELRTSLIPPENMDGFNAALGRVDANIKAGIEPDVRDLNYLQSVLDNQDPLKAAVTAEVDKDVIKNRDEVEIPATVNELEVPPGIEPPSFTVDADINANVSGEDKVQALKDVFNNLDDKTVVAMAQAIGEGDVESLSAIVDGLDNKTVVAMAQALGYSSVEELKGSITSMDGKTVQAIAEALGITDVKGLQNLIDNTKGKDVDVNANANDNGVSGLKSVIDSVQSKTVTITAIGRKIGEFVSGAAAGIKSKIGGVANGTANVNGTAFANGTTGRAFKQGNWSTKDNGMALGGELGQETVVRDGRFFTIGDRGAEFFNYKKGDIIFNHRQTEELFKNGKVTSSGGRGKALAGGSAFSNGTTPKSGLAFSSGGSASRPGGSGVVYDTNNIYNYNIKTGNSKNNYSSPKEAAKEAEKEFEEIIDWIEVAIDRIERAIDNLDTVASSTFRKWSERSKALKDQMREVSNEIDLQKRAYDRYIQEANNVGLSADWAQKVRDGKVDIETIKDEDLNKKISSYKEWYEKALDCRDAIIELQEEESKLYQTQFDNVATKFEGMLGVIQHEQNMLEEFIAQSEAKGYITSTKYYTALIANAQKQKAELEKQKAEQLAALEEAMKSETIKKGSEAWFEMVNAVDETTMEIEQLNTSILEFDNNIRDIKWEIFDLLQEQISNVADEAQFLIDLMDNDKLFEDNGQLTDDGLATLGLHGSKYNVYMAQADKYAEEIKKIQAELAKDPYDQELAKRKQELIEAQQDSILAAEDEKNAIRDMVEEGINLELDYLDELIEKRQEALEAQKDAFDYQKKMAKATKEIASIEKQMAAYANDDSEEAKQKVQQLKVELEEAKADLEETEYDKYISDQQDMMDSLYEDYEEILNKRLDNIDALMLDMIDVINENANTISNAILGNADEVGYDMSDAIDTIWNPNADTDVISAYGKEFSKALTTTNSALNAINVNLQNMIKQLNEWAGTDVKSASDSSAYNSKEANWTKPEPPKNTTPPKEPEPSIAVGGRINAGGARIYADSYGAGGGTQYFGYDPIYTVLDKRNGYLLTRWYGLSSGYTGWFRESDVSAYATGKKLIDENEMAWTQENGAEMIVRPSDGAILTPLAKGDSVLTSAASNNIWDMANNPADFIKDNLGTGNVDASVGQNVQTSCVQNFENINFVMPNVKNYEETLAQIARDKRFEKFVSSITVDKIVGKSSLAKGKVLK